MQFMQMYVILRWWEVGISIISQCKKLHCSIGGVAYMELFDYCFCCIWTETIEHSLYSILSCRRDDVIKWKHFPRYWPFVWGIQWRGALIFSLICTWINGWVNNRDTGDFRRNRVHYDVTIMSNLLFEPLLTFITDFVGKKLNMD